MTTTAKCAYDTDCDDVEHYCSVSVEECKRCGIMICDKHTADVFQSESKYCGLCLECAYKEPKPESSHQKKHQRTKSDDDAPSTPEKKAKVPEEEKKNDNEAPLPRLPSGAYVREAGDCTNECVKFRRGSTSVGNYQDGGVYVGVSTINQGTEKAMLGAFAGKEYKKGQWVTFYCSLVVSHRPDETSYVSRIAGSHLYLDGYPLAMLFDRTGLSTKAAGTKVGLIRDMDTLYANIPSLARALDVGGLGFMVNENRTHNNVKFDNQPQTREGIELGYVVLIATRDIKKGDEILLRTYGKRNTEH